MRYRAGLALGTFVALAGSCLLVRAQVPVPDLILSNGTIVTVDDRFTIAEAVAVLNERIVGVGTSADMDRLAGPRTRRIDLHGRTVIPGLIDNHLHLLRAAETWPLELRWEGVYSRRQAIEMLRAKAEAVGPGGWVFNIGGWATAQFADDATPFTREELDQIAPSNPVALQESYYQVFLNSRALAAFGIRPGAPDPPDFVAGSIVRDPSGRPTGVIREGIAATRAVAARLPRVARDQLERSAAGLFADMNRAGLTAIGAVGCDPDILAFLQRWKAEGRLSLRVFCIDGASAGSPGQVSGALAQIAAMRISDGDDFIDTVAFGESVYRPLHDPMFDTTSEPGSDDLAQWRRLAMGIARAGLPLHVHAELTTTIDAFLDQIESVDREVPIRDLRWALAHVNQITPAQLERMKRLGVSAAVHPWAVINGAFMREGFGDGASAMPPLAAIQASGIAWGLGSDGTAANQYLPFTTLSFAVTGRMAGGRRVTGQTISRKDALVAHTRRNAAFVLREHTLGSLQVGRLADMVVLDRDYLSVPADQIGEIASVMTIVGGRVVYESDTSAPPR
jgi:hypothetical protein